MRYAKRMRDLLIETVFAVALVTVFDLSISLAQGQQFSPLGMDKADSQHNRGLRVSGCMVSTFLAKLRFLDCGRVTPFVPPPPLGFPYPAHSFLASGLLCSANKPN